MPVFAPKRRTSVLLALSVSPLPFLGWAAFAANTLPSGGSFVAGAGKIAGSANQLTVTQSTRSGIIDWSAFSIGQGNSVRIDNGSGATLNRVTGTSTSSIAGALTSTGSAYLVNQNGIVVTPSGRVITGGSFVASTRDTSNSAFMQGGNLEFTGTSSGTVTNQGSISAGGNAVLIGKTVSNSGNMYAPNGTAGVVASDDVVLQPAGTGLQIQVNTGSGNASNSGNIAAAQVMLNAAGGNVFALAGNNGGIVRATGTQRINGQVWLTAGGTTQVTGTIDAQNASGSGGKIDVQGQTIAVSGTLNASDVAAKGSGGQITVGSPTVAATTVSGTLVARGGRNGGNGGSIETSGEVLNTAGIKVDTTAPKGQTGNWTLDPYNVTISSAATSNNALSSGTFTPSGNDSVISVTDLQNALQTTNVTVTTGAGGSQTGDITVAAPLTWSANGLTLDAYHSININAAVYASGTAGLTMKTNDGGTGGDLHFNGGNIGFANTSEALTINGAAYTLVASMTAVQAINNNLSGNYALTNSLDASGSSGWIPLGTSSGGSVINGSNGFAGTFEGLGNTISNLTVSAPSNFGGLFGYSSGTIRDIGIVGGSVSSSNSYAGGLVGESTGSITNAFATDAVSGGTFVGGLVGYAKGSITASYALGAANGYIDVGGLVGGTAGATITNTYATGAVTGTPNSNSVGGLVGNASNGTISSSFASGTVTTSGPGFAAQLGGLVGTGSGVAISNVYATGSVTGYTDVGGLAGELSGGSVTSGYSVGRVTGSTASGVGGLVGLGSTSSPTGFTSSYWDTQVSGQTASAGGTGQTTAQLQGTLPAGFDPSVWGTAFQQYPYLLWHVPAPSVVPQLTGSVIKTYDGTLLATLGPANYNVRGILPADQGSVVLTVNGTPISSPTTGMFSTKNAGTGLAVTVTGMALNQGASTDYVLVASTIAANIGTINPATLTYTANPVVTTYGSPLPSFSGSVTGFVTGETLANATTGTASFTSPATSSSNAGIYAINGSGLTANNGNYIFAQASSNATALTINPASLTLSADNQSQTYGGVQPALTYTATGLVNGDTTASLGTQPTLTTVRANSNAGTYPISIGGAYDPNYTITYVNGVLTINPAALTLTADNQSQTYGGAQPALSYTPTGLVNGDTKASFTTQPTLGTVAANSNAGSYPITIGGAVDPNYTISYVNGTLTINPAALTLTADNKSQIYGGAQPALTYTATGLVNGDSTASFTTQPTLTTVAANSNAGTYPIAIGGASDANYTISYVSGTLTINPAALTLTADNKSQIYGGSQPALTYTATGLVNGDTTASFATLPTLATVAANSSAGSYPITIGGASDANYSISYVSGTLTINPAALTLTADNKSQTYGGVQPALTYTATGLVNGDSTASLGTQPTLTTVPATSNAGTYPIAIGGAYDTNYAISYVDGTLTINPAALTLTADNKSQTYGGSQPALTYTPTGLVNGDTTASLGTQPTLATVAANSNAGTYPITIGSAIDPNYTISYVSGTLTINPASLTLTADNKSQTYGGLQPLLTYTATGLVNGDTTASFATQPALATVAANSNAGTYPITISGAADANYTISYVNGALTINPAALTLTANNKSQIYGGSQPALTYMATGLVNGDSTGSFTTQPTLATVAANSNAGSYPITIGGASDANYTISYVNGTLTISPAALTLTANNQSQIYGGVQPALTYTATGLVNGDTAASLVTQPTLTTVPRNSNAGTYPITIGGAYDANYVVSYVNGALTINPAALTLTADNKSQTYGGVQPALTYTATGLVNGDTTASFTTQPTLATVAANSNAGIYPITISGALDPNYTTSYVNGALTINPASLTLAADNKSQTYGGTQPALTYTATGLVNGDTTASFATLPTLGTVAANSNAGTYPITIGGASDANYTISYVNGALTINPAGLTLTADNKSQTYGGSQPALSYTATGFVNGDSTASFATQPTLATVAANSNAGTYPITIGGASDANYTISYVNGTLTINPAALTLTANNQSQIYGGSQPSLTYTALGLADGDTTASLGTQPTLTTAAANSNAGTYPIMIGAALDPNYTISYVTGILTINPAALTLTADSKSKTYGGAQPALTYTATGLANGDTTASLGTQPTLATVAANSNAGSYPITISGASDANYAISYVNGTLTINPAGLTLTADNKSQTYGGSQPALTYTATGLVNGDTTASFATQPALATVAANSNAGSYPITIGGASDANYAISYVNGALTINPAALTLTADNKSQTYGGSQPALSYTATGLVNGDTTGSFTAQPTLATVAANSNAGTYPITIGGASDANYTISYVNGALTINPAALTLTADSKSQTYGGSQPALTYTATGLVNGDSTVSFTTQPTLSTVAANSNAGSYPITIGGASDANYAISYVNGALTINPAALTLTADNQSQTYGGTQPALTYTATGLVNGDTKASLTTQPTLATVAANSNAGSYPITIGGAVDPNYTISYVNGTLTINPVVSDPTVTPALTGSVIKTYDGTLLATLGPSNYKLSGVLPADQSSVVLTVNGTPVTSPTTGLFSTKDVGTGLAVTVSGLGLNQPTGDDYVLAATGISGNIGTINPATLTYTANPVVTSYGSALPSFSGSVTGFVNGETLASATTGTSSFTSTATSSSNAGSYPINGSGLTANNGNYVFVQALSNPTALTISPALLTLTADNKSEIYGGAQPALSYTAAGLVNGDTKASLGTQPALATVAANSNAGRYPITIDGASDPNYTIAYVSGTLTINPAALTLTADNKSQTYGGVQPALTYTATGLVNGDTTTSLGSQPTLTTVAANSNAGTYPIMIGAASDPNYTISYVNGRLTINPAVLTISAVSATKVYDGTTTSSQTPAYQVAGLAPDKLVGSDSFSTLVQTYNSKNVATANTLSVSYQLSDPGNYQITTKTAAGSITALPLLLTGTRLYNGTTNAAASILTMVNLVAGDQVTLSGTGVLVGNGLTNGTSSPGFARVGTLALGGAAAGNYTLAKITTPVQAGANLYNTVRISFNGVRLTTLPRGTSLAGLNLSGANLSGANLSHMNLTGTNLSGANLSGANLRGATLTNADLAGARLTGADLMGDNLAGANLTGANLSGANLSRADLINAILVDANLSHANLSFSNLTGANLTGAKLTGANLHGAIR